ncbi:tetratricopeptide repeat protein [Photobacterium jeanii]|uniref:tetratricopeptide repeat protein n=1 Tax=Photobacterium jeanii TaxID=858640 RepID=UPI000D178561
MAAVLTSQAYAATNDVSEQVSQTSINQQQNVLLSQADIGAGASDSTKSQQAVSDKASMTPSTASAEQVQQWVYIAQDKRQTAQVRAKALRQLAPYPSQNSLVAVARSLQDDSDLVREAAVIAAEPYQFAHRWRMLSPLLQDQSQQVRVTTTANLIRDFGKMTPDQQQSMTVPFEELKNYLKAQTNPKSMLLLADVYRWHQDWDKAQSLYEQLLKSEPQNVQVWLSVADNLRAQDEDSQALDALNKAIALQPNEANLYYSKALTLVRLEQKEKAAKAIEQAAQMAQTNSYFWYLNGVLQEPLDIEKSVTSFEQAYLISGAPEQLYAVCDIYVRTQNSKTQACLTELGKIAPDYVIEQLEAKRKK